MASSVSEATLSASAFRAREDANISESRVNSATFCARARRSSTSRCSARSTSAPTPAASSTPSSARVLVLDPGRC